LNTVRLLAGLAVVFLLVAPPLLPVYHQNVLTFTVLMAYLGVAWNILGGLTGAGSFGHSAFFGIGAYTSSMLYITMRLTPWAGMLVGAVMSAIAAAVFGYLTFRFGIKGHFFFLATIAFAEILRNIVMNTEALGGARGLPIPLTEEDSLIDFQFHTWRAAYYYIALMLLVFGLAVFRLIHTSSLGLRLMAIKDDEEKAACLGVNTLAHKVLAFVISAAMTSIGGTFYAQYVLYVEPTVVLGVPFSVQIVLLTVIGGLGTFIGPVLGAFIMQPIIEYMRIFFGRFGGLDLMLAGIALILVSLLKPSGIIYMLAPSSTAKAKTLART